MSSNVGILFNNVHADNAACGNVITKHIQQVVSSGRYVLGNYVGDFENAFAKYLGGGGYVAGLGSGTDALSLSLIGLGVQPFDRVATVATSAPATATAIASIGATPVFVDCLNDGHMDPNSLRIAIGDDKIRAIVPVHLYGKVSSEFGRILEIAKEQEIPVVEDACQAHGAVFQGKKAGTMGEVGCFSFYPTKNLGCMGDAGAVYTQDASLVDKLRALRSYGMTDKYKQSFIGRNSRLDEIQAAILFAKLPFLDAINRKRKDNAKGYIDRLSQIEGVEVDPDIAKDNHNRHLFTIKVPTWATREQLGQFLWQRNIQCFVHYPIASNTLPIYGKQEKELPRTEDHCNRIMSVPFYCSIPPLHVAQVCAVIEEFFRCRKSS